MSVGDPLRIQLHQQVLIVQRNREAAFERLVGILYTHKAEIERLATERLSGIGVAQYGDEMFFDSPDVRLGKILEEFADAWNYAAAIPETRSYLTYAEWKESR
jgi:hypothetical protein